MGGRKIAVKLQKEGYTISCSHTDRLVTPLLKEHRIVPARAWYKGITASTTTRVAAYEPPSVQNPGDLVHIDTLHVHIPRKGMWYQMSAKDTVSRMAHSDIYPRCEERISRRTIKRRHRDISLSYSLRAH